MSIDVTEYFKITVNFPLTLWALDHGEMCVCDLAAMLDVSESAVSQQLRTLRHLSLVANRREGTVLYYRLMDEHVRQLVNMALEHVRE